jgi:hypothetical protein
MRIGIGQEAIGKKSQRTNGQTWFWATARSVFWCREKSANVPSVTNGVHGRLAPLDGPGKAGRPLCPQVPQNGQNGRTAAYTECQKFCLIGGGVCFKNRPTSSCKLATQSGAVCRKYGVFCERCGGRFFAELTIDIGPLRADGLGSVTGVGQCTVEATTLGQCDSHLRPAVQGLRQPASGRREIACGPYGSARGCQTTRLDTVMRSSIVSP